MYTYHEPIVGLAISRELYYSEFSKFIYDVVEEYDYFDSHEFKSEHIVEFLKEELNKNSVSDEEIDIAKKYFNWISEQSEHLDFNTGYHGSCYKPMYLKYTEAEIIDSKDNQTFTWSKGNLHNICNDVDKFVTFCKETMPKDLYDFLSERRYIGLQFISMSS